MSRYKDRQYPQSTVFLLLITAFLLIFSPWLSGLRELHWLEGNFALRALEMNFWIPVVQEYGQVIPYACPLYPFLAKILIHFGIPPEMALRVLSETALLLLALLVYYTTKRNSNATAAAVATAVLISSCIVIEKAMDGYPDTLTVLLIFIGQMLWFNYGANRSDWNWVWIGFFAAVALAFYNGGLAAFLYAAFPLIFMRRPLSISHKLNKGGFYLALAIFGLLLFLWALPFWMQNGIVPFAENNWNIPEWSDYLEHLVLFPLDAIWRFLPWTFLAWTPFCVAFQELDPTPIFSRFLRTLFIALFALLWLSPFTDPRDFLYLAPSLAILSGHNYYLLMCRYGGPLQKLLRPVPELIILAGGIILFFYLIPQRWIGEWFADLHYRTEFFPQLYGVIIGCGCILLGSWLWKRRGQAAIWVLLLVLSVAGSLFYWAIVHPYKSSRDDKRSFAQEVRTVLQADSPGKKPTVYLYGIRGLYAESVYLGVPVHKIRSLTELPGQEKTVYVFGAEYPRLPERRWVNLLPDFTYMNKRVSLWRGDLPEQKDSRDLGK